MHTLPKRALAVACAAALLGTGTSALAAESVPASAIHRHLRPTGRPESVLP